MANILFSGFVFDDSGAAVGGATVNLYDRNTVSPVRATTTTDVSGYWTISHATQGVFDIEIVNGSSKRRRKYDDAIQVDTLEVQNLSVRGSNDAFAHAFTGTPTAARTLTLPDESGTVALLGAGSLQYGTLGSRPAASVSGAMYYATDNGKLYYDTGAAWVEAGTAWNKFVLKTTAESVTSSTTLQNDNDFVVAAGANEKWAISLRLVVQLPGGGFKFAFTYPASSTGLYQRTVAIDSAGGGGGLGAFNGVTALSAISTTFSYTSFSFSGVALFDIEIEIDTAGSAGDIQFQWAQQGSSGTPTVVQQSSIMTARRMV